MRNLSDVESFGATDADNDDLLLASFEDHEAFLAARARRRFLVVGRKGSGKTAIFKRLLTLDEPTVFQYGHTFSDYPWDHHALQARVGIPDFDKYTHSWKYLIYLTASKILLNFDEGIPHTEGVVEPLARLERFVVDTYGTKDPDLTQLFLPTRKLRLKPNVKFNAGLLSAGVAAERVPMSELPKVVQDVNASLLTAVLECLHPDHEYFVCFDQLDLGFDPGDTEYSNRLIGLLLAARDVNQAARAANKQLFIVLFLRDDILNTLHFEDKNKIVENDRSLIEWDTPRTENTLKRLMEKRFSVALEQEVVWDDVFDEDQEMPGRQTKYQHMLDRTYLRPRDMIRFSNDVLKQYQTRVGDGGDGRFVNQDIHGARVQYSEYLERELDDEVFKHEPEYQRFMDVLRGVGTWQFDRERFDAEWAKLIGEGDAVSGLEALYSFSILSFYRPGGRGYGGSEYVFRHKEPSTAFDPASTRFRVHPGLIEVLGLRKV